VEIATGRGKIPQREWSLREQVQTSNFRVLRYQVSADEYTWMTAFANRRHIPMDTLTVTAT